MKIREIKKTGGRLIFNKPARDDVRKIAGLAAVRRLVVLRRLAGGLVFRGCLRLLALLLLFLLQLLLLLPVFLLELPELLLLFLVDLLLFLIDLLPSGVLSFCLLSLLLLLNLSLVDLLGLLLLSLVDLLPSSVHSISLLNPLLFLDLFLLDLLALLVLFQAELVQLLLMPLIELRVHRGIWIPAGGPSASRAIVIGLFAAVVCGRIPRLIALWLLSGVVGGRWPVLYIGLNIRLWLTRTIAVVVLWLTGPVGTNVLWSRSLGGRCDLDVRTSLLRVLGLRLHLTHLRDGRRPASIGLNRLLLLYEGCRSRGRWRLSHDGAFLKPRWWPCRTAGAGAKHASLLRRNRWGGRIDLRGLNFPAIDPHHVSSDGLCRREILLRCGGYPITRGLVHVLDVGDVLVHDHVVVVIVHNRVIHRRIGDVHVCYVSAAHVIRRHVDLTRPKREPGHADSTASSDSNADAEVWSANPGDKGWGVNRAHVADTYDRARRAWHPTPNAADSNPSAVMEWRKPPRGIIYPSPAPW